MSTAQDQFAAAVAVATSNLRGAEVVTCTFGGEDTDFARFNNGKVRQAGNVSQRSLGLDLIDGAKHATGSISLTGRDHLDTPAITVLVAELREAVAASPDDPYLLINTEPTSSETVRAGDGPDAEAAVAAAASAAAGNDLVGVFAGGSIYSGFANSLGQQNWFASDSFSLDWSLHHRADKAVKAVYADTHWSADAFERAAADARAQLEVVARPPKRIERGGYRVYLSPTAMTELMQQLAYGGFGLKAQRTRQTPLLALMEGEAAVSTDVRLSEATGVGVAPNFNRSGFLKPDEVELVAGGKVTDALISPRSAQEYGVSTNGAESYEVPSSLALGGGSLPMADALAELDTGLWIGNLWYLNWSDRNACRTTGMTRFATFWVEGGEIVAPVDVMRFDESIYRILGDNLVALTTETELLLSDATYGGRSTDSMRLPGAIVDDFRFTL